MGRIGKPPAKRADSESDEVTPLKSVVFLSSSDDEEANKDLSLEIVERALKREWKRKKVELNGAISLSSASSEDIETSFETEDKSKKMNKKSKGSSRSKKEVEAEAVEAVDAAPEEQEPVVTADSIISIVNEVPNNVVLRKLLVCMNCPTLCFCLSCSKNPLGFDSCMSCAHTFTYASWVFVFYFFGFIDKRGPRYFDPAEKDSGACFNCGEEGHIAVECTMEKRKKPCFVCGMFGHNAKHCTQGQDCYVCKRRGHIAKNCPDRHNCTPQDSNICVQCGELGHDMLSCKNDYAPDDLKEMQCYVCKNYGHLCCADFVDDGPREVSCYNCAQPGHTGLGCAKLRGENRKVADVASARPCYKCGEEGHFARGCTKKLKLKRREGGSSTPWKFEWREGGSSTPRKISNKIRDPLEFRSVPRDFGKAGKNKKLEYEDRWNTMSSNLRRRGGWIADDPGDLPRSINKANGWKSPATPTTRKSHKVYSSASSGWYHSSSQSQFKKHKSFLGTPNSNTSTSSHYHNGYSPPRFLR